MPRLGPVKRRELIASLGQLGFEGPFRGTKHEFMARRTVVVRLPNPHQGDIGVELLRRILRHARVSRDEWEAL